MCGDSGGGGDGGESVCVPIGGVFGSSSSVVYDDPLNAVGSPIGGDYFCGPGGDQGDWP